MSLHSWSVKIVQTQPGEATPREESFTIAASNMVAAMERVAAILRGVYERSDGLIINISKVE